MFSGPTMAGSSTMEPSTTPGLVLPGGAQRTGTTKGEGPKEPPSDPLSSEGWKYEDWIEMDYDQAKHFQAWSIPRSLWRELEDRINRGAEVYCDHSTDYREEELYLVDRAWGDYYRDLHGIGL